MQWWMRPGPSVPARSRSRARGPARCASLRHAHVGEADVQMAVRRVVARHRLSSRAASRCPCVVGGHEQHRMARVPRRLGVGQRHHDIERAARIAGARRPPFLAVEHPFVALKARIASRYWWRPTRRRRARSSDRPSARAPRADRAASAPSARASRSAPAPPCCRCRAPSS